MKRSLRLGVYLCLTLMLFSSLAPLKVFATDTAFYAANGILFYNPDDTSCGTAGGPSTIYNGKTAVGTLVANDALKAIFTQLLTSSPNQLNPIQVAAIMGNMYGESGLNPTASEAPIGPGYGLAQWSDPGRKAHLLAFAAQQGKPESDPSVQVDYLLKEYNDSYVKSMKGTDFDNATDIAKATTAWMNIFENPLNKTGVDPSGLNSKRIPAAIKIYGFYSNLTPSIGTTTPQANCASTTGVVAGKVVDTAINLALTTPQTDHAYTVSNADGAATGQSDARSTYQVAKPKYNPTVAWSDCGGFIATIMISSGADPNYPPVGVSTQIAYVESHPDKYLIIPNPTISDLQPGDILLSNDAGHTMMYTGATQYPDVDASLTQRVPGVRASSGHVWMFANNSIIARLKT